MKRIFGLLLAVLLLCSLLVPAYADSAAPMVTVMFTHDLHSHLLPADNEKGESYGGYARLKTVIDSVRATDPNAILVDGGDFSMGSLFQTVYATDASELRVMGALGYDVTTFGNHEYDYRATGIASMLNAAVDSGEPLPQIVEANYLPPQPGDEGYDETAQAVQDAMDRYGIKPYTVISRGGVNFAMFGILGKDSHSCAPMSGMILHDPIETAKEMVAKIEAEVAEPRVVIALSHSGLWSDPEKSEDELLAAAVDGIDLIVSGHTHSTLDKPLEVNGTYIVSCGEYSKNLGVIQLMVEDDGVELYDYTLIPVNDQVEEDSVIPQKVEQYKGLVESSYLSRFGDWSYDTVLAHNPYEFGSQSALNIHQESALGNLIADSYIHAVKEAEGDAYETVDFAVTANGVIRESLPKGDITVEAAFNVESLGIGADGVAGYPLLSVYLTGKDLKNAFEVDASVTPIMGSAQLYFSGASFTFNPNRMIFNKVTDCALVREDGSREEIKDDELYRVVTGLYCGQMLGLVNSQSFGILEVTPRDASGEPITDLEAHIIHNPDGTEVKEWYAIASYLEAMGTVSEDYGDVSGRKVIVDSKSPVALLKNANRVTMAVIAVVLVLILLIVLIVRLVVKIVRKRKSK
ncbi:MAG: bifunctional metallophosphatase/5'-nucleotidase [Oscillospiraceae bacterium]|nr:bifunctional metallophosphatase/5'-nucleotidase [Oscillospiraceae bacterium]